MKSNNSSKNAMTGLLFTVPSLAGFMIFFIIPFLISVFYSFNTGVENFNFAGFDNYKSLFASSSFRLALFNTFRFIASGVPLLIALSLLSALLFEYLHKKHMKHLSAYRTMYILPMVIPEAAIVIFLQILFNRYGVLNSIDNGTIDWFNTHNAFYIILMVFLWKNCGYCMIIFSAGLSYIDSSIYEAAEIDGANSWQKFIYITFVNIIPSIFFVAIMGIIGVFKMFRISYLLVGQYPYKDIYMLQNFMNNNFLELNYQRLSTSSVVVFAIMAVLVIIMLNISDRDYD